MDEVRERFQNLHEIVAAARTKLNRNVWDYLIGGAETETTVRRNRLALDSLALRPRQLGSATTNPSNRSSRRTVSRATAPTPTSARPSSGWTPSKARARSSPTAGQS